TARVLQGAARERARHAVRFAEAEHAQIERGEAQIAVAPSLAGVRDWQALLDLADTQTERGEQRHIEVHGRRAAVALHSVAGRPGGLHRRARTRDAERGERAEGQAPPGAAIVTACHRAPRSSAGEKPLDDAPV